MPTSTYPVPAIGSELMIPVPVSFETNEQWSTAVKLPKLPFRLKLKRVESVVTKALADTDDGTVTVKKGATALASITIAASAAIGDEDSDSTVTDTAFNTTDQISITTAKSTAGGKGMLYLTVEVLPSH